MLCVIGCWLILALWWLVSCPQMDQCHNKIRCSVICDVTKCLLKARLVCQKYDHDMGGECISAHRNVLRSQSIACGTILIWTQHWFQVNKVTDTICHDNSDRWKGCVIGTKATCQRGWAVREIITADNHQSIKNPMLVNKPPLLQHNIFCCYG